MSTTLTVPPRIVPKGNLGVAVIGIHTTCGRQCGSQVAEILVLPGGGPGSVQYQGYLTPGTFRVSPQVGDQLQLSIYYDQRGHDYFTATDLTQHTTQTAQQAAGGINPVYDHAELYAAAGDAQPPAADTLLWKFAGTRLTTYTGVHGGLQGPWQLAKWIQTSDGTAASTVVASPSGLSNGGQDFGVWLRALPLTFTQGVAGYVDSGGPFRFITTTLTVPARQDPPAGHEQVRVGLDHPGATNIRAPQAEIDVFPGGGKYSVLIGGWESGGFTISPNVGDQLTVSIYYDQHGHYVFTATDLTQHTTQTVTTTAFFADQPLPLNRAWVLAPLDNDTVVPPPADARLWAFTGTRITTYGGTRGGILGPGATSQMIDTTDGTAAGAVVMSPSALSNAGQNFGVWLRHR